MKRYIIMLLAAAMPFAWTACTSQEEPGKKPVTVRERAQAVGKFSDRTFTRNLEKNLVGVVDSSDKHAEELEKAAQ